MQAHSSSGISYLVRMIVSGVYFFMFFYIDFYFIFTTIQLHMNVNIHCLMFINISKLLCGKHAVSFSNHSELCTGYCQCFVCILKINNINSLVI